MRDRSAPSAASARVVLTACRVGVVVFVAAVVTYGAFRLVSLVQRFASFTVPLTAYLLVVAVIVLLGLVSLRTEDARLTRELRIAYAGTVTARAQAVRQRLRASWLARLFTAPHGYAALLLASGDAENAAATLETGSPLYLSIFGARLGDLHELVAAGARAALASDDEARSAALTNLLALPRPSARGGAAHLGRFHASVLARAVLEAGDALTARDLAHDLASSPDVDVRLYAEWLRCWFDIDLAAGLTDGVTAVGDPGVRPADEGERRRAALLAANAGAKELAMKITTDIATAAAADASLAPGARAND